MTDSALSPLITALMEPGRYPHAVDAVELIETHISWVLLAGEFAYKIKKPVALGFLDFSTLDARRHFCEEELRLNRLTAPQLYLDVLPIGGDTGNPVMGGGGPPIEYALRMRRFDQAALLDRLAHRGQLTPALMDSLATVIATFHAAAPVAVDGLHGSAESVCAPAVANFDQIEQLAPPPAEQERLAALRVWTVDAGAKLQPLFTARKTGGSVRECHGDLHLRNIALIEDTPVLFDCIEFDPELRWIDVISEIAFLLMDLFDRGLDALAWRFLDGYLQESGDYEGVAVLRYYLVYRALVRAKVALIHARQLAAGTTQGDEAAAFSHYLRLAQKFSVGAGGALILMHGLSGSGKSRLSQVLAAALGAVRVRSDVERKRLAGLAAGARSASAPGGGIYAAPASAGTYARLAGIATCALAAGWRVIIDAASLQRVQRESMRAVAAAAAAPFVLVTIEAPPEVLRERLLRRARAAVDVSEADVGVLELQLRNQEPLDNAERAVMSTVAVATADNGADTAAAITRIEAAIEAARNQLNLW